MANTVWGTENKSYTMLSPKLDIYITPQPAKFQG